MDTGKAIASALVFVAVLVAATDARKLESLAKSRKLV